MLHCQSCSASHILLQAFMPTSQFTAHYDINALVHTANGTPPLTVQGSGGNKLQLMVSPAFTVAEALTAGEPLTVTRPALMLAWILALLASGSCAAR